MRKCAQRGSLHRTTETGRPSALPRQTSSADATHSQRRATSSPTRTAKSPSASRVRGVAVSCFVGEGIPPIGVAVAVCEGNPSEKEAKGARRYHDIHNQGVGLEAHRRWWGHRPALEDRHQGRLQAEGTGAARRRRNKGRSRISKWRAPSGCRRRHLPPREPWPRQRPRPRSSSQPGARTARTAGGHKLQRPPPRRWAIRCSHTPNITIHLYPHGASWHRSKPIVTRCCAHAE